MHNIYGTLQQYIGKEIQTILIEIKKWKNLGRLIRILCNIILNPYWDYIKITSLLTAMYYSYISPLELFTGI